MGSTIPAEASGDEAYVVSLSDDGTTIAIGGPRNDGPNNSGHVRVYKLSNNVWNKLGDNVEDINGESKADRSGVSVSISADGTAVAIGATHNDGNGDKSGHVRVFTLVDNSWTQRGPDIDGESSNDRSGQSVSLSADGMSVAIGADRNAGNGDLAGHVRVYRFSNDEWNKLGIDLDGENGGDRSGYSVSISADGLTVAIGAYQNDGNGVNNAGHVRVYKFSNDNWTQLGLDIDGEGKQDRSGFSISLSADGMTVAVGAFRNDGNGDDAGHVRIYTFSNDVWTQVGHDIDGESSDDRSSYSVSLSDDGITVAIGANQNDENGNDSGHVRAYRLSNNFWTKLGPDIDGENENDKFGSSVSLSADGMTLASGAFNGGENSGGYVRIFKYGKYILYSKKDFFS